MLKPTILSEFAEDKEAGVPLITREPSRHTKRSYLVFISFVVHAVLAISWVTASQHALFCQKPQEYRLWPREFQAAAEAVEYGTFVFDPANYSLGADLDHPYLGTTYETDVAWWHLYDVGFIVLTTEQNEALETPTMNVSLEDPRPLIQLDVFHQLHCLASIRRTAYKVGPWDLSEPSEHRHLDHCFEYLRQILMCHSDLTPISNIPREGERKPGQHDWRPDFATVHTCRNFEKIHKWATKANTSGAVTELHPGWG